MYQLIRDQVSLDMFINWLPDLEENEQYFLCLQARKKYMPGVKTNDKLQLKRFCATKKNLLRKIKQLECGIGTYKTNFGEDIPNEALVLYITPNPRDMNKAAYNTISALAKILSNGGTSVNPSAEALSQIHKAKSRSVFVHFDVDYDGTSQTNATTKLHIEQIYSIVSKIVGTKALTLVGTRGGVHILIRPNLVESENKNWYPLVTKSVNCDQTGDLMLPVVGCNQGGMSPYFF